MPDLERYHRTYLPDGSYGPICNPSGKPSDKRQDFLRRPPLIDPKEFQSGPARLPDGTPLPRHFRRQPMVDLRQPKPVYQRGQSCWKALRYTGQSLAPIFMGERPDQDFARFTTQFERDYSKLAGNWGLQQAMEVGIPVYA